MRGPNHVRTEQFRSLELRTIILIAAALSGWLVLVHIQTNSLETVLGSRGQDHSFQLSGGRLPGQKTFVEIVRDAAIKGPTVDLTPEKREIVLSRELTVLVPISEVELVNRVKERVYKSDESPDDIDWRSLLSFVDDVEFIEQGVIEKKEATVTDEHMPERTLDTVDGKEEGKTEETVEKRETDFTPTKRKAKKERATMEKEGDRQGLPTATSHVPVPPPTWSGDPRRRAITYYGTDVTASCKSEQPRRHPAALCCTDDFEKAQAALQGAETTIVFRACNPHKATDVIESVAGGTSHVRKLKACFNFFHTRAPTDDKVTLVTQLTADRLPMLELMAKQYQGPISAAFYVIDFEKDFCVIYKLFAASEDVRRFVSLHLVFSAFHDKDSSLRSYPVNALRNAAWARSTTPFVFLSDVDMIPSYNLSGLLTDKVSNWNKMCPKKKCILIIASFEVNFDEKKSGYPENVIEDFQWLVRQGIPANKAELLPYIEKNYIFQVHRYKGKHAHDPTDYGAWASATVPYKIKYDVLYEPYFVGPSSMPKFPEEFMGYGNDKCSQTLELEALKYEFVVAEEGFLLHYGHRWPQWKSFIDSQKSWTAWAAFVRKISAQTGYRLEYPQWVMDSIRKGEIPKFVLNSS